MVCKGKPKRDNSSSNGAKPKKNNKGKSRKVSESSDETDDSDTDSIGRVEEIKSTTEDKLGEVKERRTMIKFKPVTSEEILGEEVEMVIDTGATRPILTENDWEKLREKFPRLKLKKTSTKFCPTE